VHEKNGYSELFKSQFFRVPCCVSHYMLCIEYCLLFYTLTWLNRWVLGQLSLLDTHVVRKFVACTAERRMLECYAPKDHT